MRIGTWNLEGRWGKGQAELMEEQDCDVWLLTEVSEPTTLTGHTWHGTASRMAPERHWAAVMSRRSTRPAPDPHPASAAVQIDGWMFVSSVLPWRTCRTTEPWGVDGHAPRTAATLDRLGSAIPTYELVWGGDWNSALQGPEHAGSLDGRARILESVSRWKLVVPTATLSHRIDEIRSIDHVAVPQTWRVDSARRVVAEVDGRRLSDHDMYVVDAQPPPPLGRAT